MEVQKITLKTGDVVKTTCHDIPFCYHLGVCVIEEGEPMIYHCTPSEKNEIGGNVICETFTDFMKMGDKVRDLIEVYSSNLNTHQIKRYAERNKDKKWDAMQYNCETFINKMLKNGINSTQLQRGLVIGIIALSIFLIITDDKN